jgi:hypothetical protein
MSSSKVFRTAGLVALCLVVGVVLSAALGGAQVGIPIPPELLLTGDPGFDSLAEQLIALTPRNRIPSVGQPEMCEWTPPWGGPPIPIPCALLPLQSVKACGATIADILIDPAAPKDEVAAARSLDDGPPLIGAARSLDDGSYLLGKVPLPKGVYYVWMGREKMLGRVIPIPPEPDDRLNNWFVFIGHVPLPPEPWTLKIVAILYYRDENFRMPEEWLRAIGSGIGLKDRGCDLTVTQLSCRARKIIPPCPPCPIPPCPPCPSPSWQITALATIANIGQIDVKEPFMVQFSLDGIPFFSQALGGLAAGAQRVISATAMVDTPGLYTVEVMADSTNQIKELDETNNLARERLLLR